MKKTMLLIGAAALALAGCAGDGDATAIAERIAADIDGATVVTVTEANDTLGRFDGDDTKSAAVIRLPGMDCNILGVACGAEVKVSNDSAAYVMKVAGYTQAMLIDNGTPVDLYVNGSSVLSIDKDGDAVTAGILIGAFDGDPALES